MDHPAFRLLLLEQGNLSRTTPKTLFLAPMTHYLDSSLCLFYRTRLNPTTRAQLSRDGPRESLAAYVDWVLVAQPTITRFADHEPKPTVDGEPEPSVTDEPSPSGATELRIAQEPEPILSEQVQEPATSQATVRITEDRKRAMESPTHCTAAEGELKLDLGLLDLEQDLTDFFGDVDEDMPTLLLHHLNYLTAWISNPPSLFPPPLSPGSPSAHPQPTISAVGSLQVCQSPSVSWLEDPSSPKPEVELRRSVAEPE
ncbi:Eukaryotic translation elongation factor 2 [Labeo rohita]|uniref:Eukaryotic translation elongation factor 2 n=1 Tax=Labeo rohita TaxID=84645 RepID=A0ABQ8MWI0_LABRO|nr:Eukaryotic translation elongation factor 2 [Labeo rohita]